jgi:predicted MFS family arabinose efflux permease
VTAEPSSVGIPEATDRTQRWQTAFAGLMAAGMAAVGAAQFAPSVLSPFLIDEFGWDRWQLGALVTGFSLTGAVGSPIVGRATDRLGGRRSLQLVFAVTLATALLVAVSPVFAWMLLAMMLGGASAAAVNPATNKLIARHVPIKRRGAVIGIKQAGGPLGITAVGALPVIAAAAGWRAAVAGMAVFSAAGLAWTALVLPRTTTGAAAPRPTLPAERHPRDPTVWWLAINGALFGGGTAAVLGFLPLYAREAAGFSEATAGSLAAVLGAVGIAARIAWGWQSSRFRHVSSALIVMSVASLVTVVVLWTAPSTWTGGLWIGAALSGATFLGWNSLGMLAVIDAVPHERAGSASGDVVLGYMTGFTATPILFGWTVDVTGSYGWAWAGVSACFVAAVVATMAWRRALRA